MDGRADCIHMHGSNCIGAQLSAAKRLIYMGDHKIGLRGVRESSS